MCPDSHTSENNDSTTVDSMQTRQPNAGVKEKLTKDSNDIVPEKPMVQNNLNQCNIEDIPLSGTEIEMVGFDSAYIHLRIWKIENEPLNPCLSFTYLPCNYFMCNSKGVLRTRII